MAAGGQPEKEAFSDVDAVKQGLKDFCSYPSSVVFKSHSHLNADDLWGSIKEFFV